MYAREKNLASLYENIIKFKKKLVQFYLVSEPNFCVVLTFSIEMLLVKLLVKKY